MVSQGQLIANVGESGTPESIARPGNEYHLHFEIRIGAGCVAPSAETTVNCAYLGKDLPPLEVRRIYQTAFSP
jgi:murein DD-endopeptidase MepM/ murein hydrolase activator NlpD